MRAVLAAPISATGLNRPPGAGSAAPADPTRTGSSALAASQPRAKPSAPWPSPIAVSAAAGCDLRRTAGCEYAVNTRNSASHARTNRQPTSAAGMRPTACTTSENGNRPASTLGG